MKINFIQIFTWNNAFEILVLTLLVVILFVAKFYLPSYFKEKGKNYAKIQDIEKLTEAVKNIEHKYDIQSQSIKAQLDLSNQISLGIHNEDRTYIIEFHKAIYEYHTFLIDYTHGSLNYDSNDDIFKYISLRSSLYDKFLTSKMTSYLFISEGSYLDAIKKIVREISVDYAKIAKEMVDFLINLQKMNSNFKNQSATEAKAFYSARSEMFDQYNKKVTDFDDEVRPKLENFSNAIKNYITQMAIKRE